MILKQIHSDWGAVIEFNDPTDFFKHDSNFWRSTMYQQKLIVFKNMQFTKEQYILFCEAFGNPWALKDYTYSKEKAEKVEVDGRESAISLMSNLISPKLGQGMMPWHADIPNRKINPFPLRTLWMIKNPSPTSGFTSFLDLEKGLDVLPPDLASKVDHIRIVQQSWYYKGTDIQEFPFVKQHPVTGRNSLRLNFFRNPQDKGTTDAWIKDVKVNGVVLDPPGVLKPFYKFLESQPDLVYTHKWDTFDILIYDNWSLVHNRSELIFDPALERLMYRANIDHIIP